MSDHVVVTYRKRQYCVFHRVEKSGKEFLFVIDAEDFDKIDDGPNWHVFKEHITRNFYVKGEKYIEYLHDIIMLDEIEESSMKVKHISGIKSDIRKDNLKIKIEEEIDDRKKFKRSTKLPKGCGITKEELPKYVHYDKPQSGHGEMFKFVHNKLILKSSSSIDYSLKDKFIEIKKKIFDAYDTYPQVFDGKPIPLNYTDKQIELMKEYNDIIKLSGFDCVKSNLIKVPESNTLTVNLDEASPAMKKYLENTNTAIKTGRKHRFDFPANSKITQEMMPIGCYCSYVKATNGINDYFIIERKPALPDGNRRWRNDKIKGRTMTTLEKYKDMMRQLVKFGFIKWNSDGTFTVIVKSGVKTNKTVKKRMAGSKTSSKLESKEKPIKKKGSGSKTNSKLTKKSASVKHL